LSVYTYDNVYKVFGGAPARSRTLGGPAAARTVVVYTPPSNNIISRTRNNNNRKRTSIIRKYTYICVYARVVFFIFYFDNNIFKAHAHAFRPFSFYIYLYLSHPPHISYLPVRVVCPFFSESVVFVRHNIYIYIYI